MHAELATIKELITTASIPEEAKHGELWCLEQLPILYEKLFQTYDNRFREEILRLEQALLKPFQKQNKKVGEAISEQLHLLHARLGFEDKRRLAA